jgi:hypothetical protein
VVTGGEKFPLTTREGWRQFVDDGPAEPKLLGDGELGLLDAAGRLAYDQDRLDYHSRLIVVATRSSGRSMPPGGGWSC